MQQIKQIQDSQSNIKIVGNEPQIFLKYLQQKEQFIQMHLIKVLTDKQKGIGHINYPIKMFKYRKGRNPQTQHGQWYYIRSRLEKRILKSSESIEKYNLILVSDLLIWSIPNFCSIYMAIQNYIRKWKQQVSTLDDKTEICQKLISQRKQQLLPDIILDKNDECIELNILKGPEILIHQYFEKFSLMIDYYQNKQKQFSSILIENEQQSEKAKVLLRLAKSEQAEIINRIKQAQKYLQQMDQGESLDPQVYKNRLFQSLYPLSPQIKKMKKYAFRLNFLKVLKIRVAKAQKHIKQRKDAIYQLVDKQRTYIQGLDEYINYIKKPIEALQILSIDQSTNLFCNIQQIKQFHIIFYQTLKNRFKIYRKYQVYGDAIKQVIPFFKIYIDYVYIAQSMQNNMIKLAKENQQVREICDKFFKQKYKTASDELMQPTFKIGRYDMLFDQVLKKTNSATADYKLLHQAKDLFKKNLAEVNETVDKIIRRRQLNMLEQQYGTVDHPIFLENRQYLNQFSCFLITNDGLMPIIIFLFSDLILLAEQQTRKKLRYIPVDSKFYVRRQQDNKTYRNVIKIHSDGYLALSTGTQEKNLKKADEMYEVLKKIQNAEQSNQLVFLHVLGTEQIGSTSFAKYTEYIIQIKFMSIKKLLHLRFSQIVNLVKIVQKHYHNTLSITEEQSLKKAWFNNHKSKIIQDRKRTIQQIFQKVFNHELVRKNPQYLLSYLNLPENFFEVARKLSGQRNSSIAFMNSLMDINQKLSNGGHSQSLMLIKKQSLTKRQLKQAFTILCATQLKLGRDIYHDMDEQIMQKKQNSQKTQIYINTMKFQQTVMVKITQFDTVQDVCNKVSKLLGLRSNRDFRLFHEIGKKQSRVLEHEQLILKIFTFPKNNPRQSIQGFFNNMTSSIKKIFSPDNHPTLVFKKYYFLPFEIEQKQFKKDLTRLRLLTYQVFGQIKDMKYQFNFDQYLLFAALMIYIQVDGDLETKKIEPQVIHRIIPQTIFKLKNYTEAEWLQKIRPNLLRIQQQIKKVIEYNKEQLKFNKIRTDTHSKMALYFGHRFLTSQIVLNKIKTNPIYGSNLFYIQPDKKTYEELKGSTENTKIAYNMWLAVKFDSLSLLAPSSKQSLFQLKYTQFEKNEVFSQAIVFKTDDYTNKVYHFNTYQSFEIAQLVKYYKASNQTLKDLEDNDGLAQKVRAYRDQIMQYRSTYHDAQSKLFG